LLKALDYREGKKFDFTSLEDFQPGDLVVLNMSRLKNNQKYKMYKNQLPEFISAPPPNWKLLARTQCRDFRIYYVLPEDEVEIKKMTGLSPLAKFFHAYSFKKYTNVVSEETQGDKAVFRLNNAQDVRIVAGDGPYIRKSDIPNLAIREKGNYRLVLDFDTSGEVEVIGAYIVHFNENWKRPKLQRMELQRKTEGLTAKSVMDLDPANGDHSYRLMLRVAGTGVVLLKDFKVATVTTAEVF
jgi:hypothetical protein